MKPSLLPRAQLLVTLALAAACGSKPSAPGRLENVGGSSGRELDASTSGGTSAGGGAEPLLDAGLPEREAPDAAARDAAPDADAPEPDAGSVVEGACVLDTIEAHCSESPCPELDAAADWLLAEDPVAVVRRPCEAADGTRFISIGAEFELSSNGYVYDAESGELVSAYLVSDAPEGCEGANPSNVAFYGRVVEECASVNPNGVTTPCEDSSGPGNGNGGNAPDECIYVDE